MPASQELMQLIQKRDPKVLRQLFDEYFNKLSAISIRYAKNERQAEEIFHYGFNHCYYILQHQRHNKNLELEIFLEKEFVEAAIQFIKSIRNEYYVSSTVHATDSNPTNYNLFESNEWVDLNHVDTQILIQSLQQLVPSQRLVFNLHVIDGKSLTDAANLLESSVETVKSNLEKARYHLQKNIEKNLKK